MSYEIDADYEEHFLLPPSVDEWVGADEPARLVRDFVDSLDLKALGFRVGAKETGRPNFASGLLLKVWLYGFLRGIRSTRTLERACQELLPCVWLAGRTKPDHSTLWRFFSTNQDRMKAVFQQTVVIGARCNLIGMLLHALDGTKIASKGSLRGCENREHLKKKLPEIEEAIEQIVSEIQSSSGSEAETSRLSADLENHKARRDKINQVLADMEAVDRGTLHTEEEEARVMKGTQGKILGYNAQLVVDGQSGLIVAENVFNDESDNHLLPTMLEEVKTNLNGVTAQDTLADGGYYSPESLAGAEDMGCSVIVNVPNSKREVIEGVPDLSAENFKHDPARDVCVCPTSQDLPFEREKNERAGDGTLRLYRCHVAKECAFSKFCSQDPRGRSIEVRPHRDAVDRQRAKFKDPIAKENYRKRSGIVEPAIGTVKERHRFRRFMTAGLNGVRGEWSLLCAAFNLLKLRVLDKSGGLLETA